MDLSEVPPEHRRVNADGKPQLSLAATMQVLGMSRHHLCNLQRGTQYLGGMRLQRELAPGRKLWYFEEEVRRIKAFRAGIYHPEGPDDPYLTMAAAVRHTGRSQTAILRRAGTTIARFLVEPLHPCGHNGKREGTTRPKIPVYRKADLDNPATWAFDGWHDENRLNLAAASEKSGIHLNVLYRHTIKSEYFPDGKLPSEIRERPNIPWVKKELTVRYTDVQALLDAWSKATQLKPADDRKTSQELLEHDRAAGTALADGPRQKGGDQDTLGDQKPASSRGRCSTINGTSHSSRGMYHTPKTGSPSSPWTYCRPGRSGAAAQAARRRERLILMAADE